MRSRLWWLFVAVLSCAVLVYVVMLWRYTVVLVAECDGVIVSALRWPGYVCLRGQP